MPPEITEEDSQPIHVLVVDDEPPIREMMEILFTKAGYACVTADNGNAALDVLQSRPIDVAITDINMPGISGVELLRKGREITDADFIVITGYVEDFSYETLIAEGASDFIYKPISNKEILLRFKRVLRERSLLKERQRINSELENSNKQLSKYAEDLNLALSDLKTTHNELQSAYLDTINRLALAAEFKDEDTGDHIMRMSEYSALVAEHYGLDERQIYNIRYASPMHDIGKIGIPDRILLKPDRLTKEEFDIIKTHTTIGASLLSNSRAELLQVGQDIALSHHEKWNGKGYPNGLEKENISIYGRIVGLMDVFDALTSSRPYKKPYPVEIACDIIRKERGESFDPDIVDIFLERIDDLLRIKGDLGSGQSLAEINFQWSARDKSDGVDQFINVNKYFRSE